MQEYRRLRDQHGVTWGEELIPYVGEVHTSAYLMTPEGCRLEARTLAVLDDAPLRTTLLLDSSMADGKFSSAAQRAAHRDLHDRAREVYESRLRAG
ncbi:hypothetical protein [Nonomuraea sp. NPDC049784]|uniref:hypothetical protein n=1 Tax=Nonomuraea sp. NPDC049784 TaxID=3154361 RepID=UPI0033EDCA35